MRHKRVAVFVEAKCQSGRVMDSKDFDSQQVVQTFAEMADRVFDDWDLTFREAKKVYWYWTPVPKTCGPNRNADAVQNDIATATAAREKSRRQLTSLSKKINSLEELSQEVIQDSIMQLGYPVTWRQLIEIFEHAVKNVPSSQGIKKSLLPYHEAGDILLSYYDRNIGKVTLYEPIKKPSQAETNNTTILWLDHQFRIISKIDKDSRAKAKTVIAAWLDMKNKRK